MKATHTTSELSYPHYGYKSYRIEVINDRQRPLQRHIWTTESGDIEEGEWIGGFYESEESLTTRHWMRAE